MEDHHTDYQPIDCAFHDLLLDRAIRRKPSIVFYQNRSRNIILRERIADVFTEKGVEYLVFADDTKIRLDQIISVDGIQRPTSK